MLGKVVVLMQEIWSKPNGRLWAERIAFEKITYSEIFRTAALLPTYEVLISKSFEEAPSDEEVKLLWKTLDSAFQQTLQTRELHENQAMLLAMSWATGMDFTQNSNLGEWIEESPETAAGFAYLCAKRCTRDGKISAARQLYNRAVELVSNDSLAGLLATEELTKLAGD